MSTKTSGASASKGKGLRVKTGLKAGKLTANHNVRPGVRVKTGLKAGKISSNHNARLVTRAV